jgi:hypothetical protein
MLTLELCLKKKTKTSYIFCIAIYFNKKWMGVDQLKSFGMHKDISSIKHIFTIKLWYL